MPVGRPTRDTSNSMEVYVRKGARLNDLSTNTTSWVNVNRFVMTLSKCSQAPKAGFLGYNDFMLQFSLIVPV